MVPPGFGGGLDDPILGQAEVVDPAADMGFEQLCEETIKFNLGRLRILLLLYRFS